MPLILQNLWAKKNNLVIIFLSYNYENISQNFCNIIIYLIEKNDLI